MDKAHIARYKPYYCELEEGKAYFWCSCGRSSKQPFCDGSHKGSNFLPIKYIAKDADEEVLFCGCKQTRDQPFCDGTHNNLLDTYALEELDNESAKLTNMITRNATNPIATLNNKCYVSNPADHELSTTGSLAWCVLISEQMGAQYQSQYYLQQAVGTSPIVSFGDSEIAMLVRAGKGEIVISGQAFQLSKHAGIYVKAGEAFCLITTSDKPLEIYATICPEGNGLKTLSAMPDNFDLTAVNRVVSIDEANAQSMGDRFFQILVGKEVGSKVLTEFIGDIPQSKAAMHRHLYEETLVILEGEGVMCTEDWKTKVVSGDIMFLPRKQIHSLECTSEKGMRLAGVIYPGDNPSINY